ncbi:MAG: DEAD/DEAH box helicase family protein [Pirellulales bacterium]|nr:DEAD/DEAH box helicase family protein [Pirellulales bacterium]
MDHTIPLAPGNRVRSVRFGQGTVELDKGATVLVRFDHGIEECERAALTVVRSIWHTIDAPEWDSPLAVANRALAYAIVSVNDAWGVFSRSRIALLPHQLWVCRRVLSTWPTRWLVADDVGLGKTVEAGLILWPLLSKGVVRRFLIICPASLVEQWQYRLRTMFDIRVARYVTEADSERTDFWATHNYVAASLETLRLDHHGRHQRLFDSPSWDLLIVDEAHHINADEQTGPTLGYKLAQRLVDEKKVTSIIFFTGTPHRGKNFGFLALLRLLRPDLFDPRKPLEKQVPLLREVVIRNNKQSVTDLRGQRLFQAPSVTSDTYEYSPEEARFYHMLTDFIVTGKAYASTLDASDRRLVIWVLITMQKLASSSVAAIRRALHGRLERIVEQRRQLEEAKQRLAQLQKDYYKLETFGRDDELSQLEEQIVCLASAARLMEDEEPRLRELLSAAEAVRRETKIERILSLVASRFAGRSVLFFTEYKATQSLLMSQLIRHYGDDCVAFINGDERAEDVIGRDGQVRTLHQSKEAAAERFNAGQVRFLVSTEAGGEGIDLQEHCHSLVHVDLPWNPMRLHQRVGRLNRYGQTQRVDVITLRNPATVEARIWDKLNEKIQDIMLAFGHVTEEPEDLLQMVLGMTSPALFRELFAEAPEVPAESLASWFNHKTATFGGRDVIATVKEIVGNCAQFDYRQVGHEVPPLDLPDLRPFVEGMLVQNQRRPRREQDGSLTFRTPKAWLGEVGVQDTYEGLVFHRGARGKDAAQRVVGVGHKVVDEALKQALAESSCVASVNNRALRQAMIVARVFDRVTGSEAPIRSVVVAAARIGESEGWARLRDWDVVCRLNELLANLPAMRRSCAPPADRNSVKTAVVAAVEFITREVAQMDLGFRVPSVEVLAVLWPGQATLTTNSPSVEADTDDQLEQ